MPKVVIGIPTYNGAARADVLLKSIAMRTPEIFAGDAIVTLVDDGSPNLEATREVARKWGGQLPGFQYIEHGVNRGISAGWNTASRSSDSPYVVLVNDDVVVSLGWLRSLLHVLERSPQVGVVGQSWHAFTAEDIPQLIADPESDRLVVPRDPLTKAQTPERRTLYEDTNPGRVMAPTGHLFAFRREDFDAIGGFDEGFASFCEETSFGTSMAANGKIGTQINWPHSWHMWSATFGASPELKAGERMRASQEYYCRKWNVPDRFHANPFDFTNPLYLGTIGDVDVEFLRRDGRVTRGVLRQDGAFVEFA